MADKAPVDFNLISPATVLPMASAQPRAMDWNHKARLSGAQKLLLEAFNDLNFSRKAQLLHGMGPTDVIPYQAIRSLYEEQLREKARGSDADALKDTTKSGVV